MKIIYIPLDERPCNRVYPQQIAGLGNQVELITPSIALLGAKKQPADCEALWQFLDNNAADADAMVLSVEMLFYGGLLPSRIHYLSTADVAESVARLRGLRSKAPQLKIYASNLIMRTPQYNSSDEEPDYYADYGQALFRRAFLRNKKDRLGLSQEEQEELQGIHIPQAFIDDYETRRAFNLNVNKLIIDLVAEGIIDFLSIPQDDSAPFGYTALDQQAVVKHIADARLAQKVHMYPGADEVGASLIARAYNQLRGERPSIYPLYASALGPQLVPLYEDRPIHESVKAHIRVTGSLVAETATAADIVLAVNTPGQVMQEAPQQGERDITYASFRNVAVFCEQIAALLAAGKCVAVADSAYANGGDLELIRFLDEMGLLDKISGYMGWNTNCNTLGTVIATAIFARQDSDAYKIKQHIYLHLLEDVCYQAVVRKQVTEQILPNYGLNYFDVKAHEETIATIISEQIFAVYHDLISDSLKEFSDQKIKVYMPWQRMFEIGLDIVI